MYIFKLPDEPRGHWAYVPSVTVGLLDVGVSCSWMAAEMLLCLSWLEKTLLRSSKSGLARWKRRHCTGVFEFADLFVFFYVSARPDWQAEEALCSQTFLFVHSFICCQTCQHDLLKTSASDLMPVWAPVVQWAGAWNNQPQRSSDQRSRSHGAEDRFLPSDAMQVLPVL